MGWWKRKAVHSLVGGPFCGLWIDQEASEIIEMNELPSGATESAPKDGVRFELLDPTTVKVDGKSWGLAIYDWSHESKRGHWQMRKGTHVQL